MTTEIARRPEPDDIVPLTPEQRAAAGSALDHIIATNDLGRLTPQQRVGYILALCKSLHLNPLSRPFEFITFDGKVVPYPTKSCAEQLGRLHQISVKLTRREQVGDLFVCEVEGSRPNGQCSFASKYVSVRDSRGDWLKGDKLGAAYAKAETGAKRRLVLSMVGLAGLPDADEIAGVKRIWMDAEGNLLRQPTEEQRYLIEHPRAARAAGYATLEDTASAEDSPVRGSSQAPTTEELTRPQRPAGPPPTFKPTPETVKRWLGAWFAAVKGTSLDDDDDRHRFVRQFSDGRTESLREWFESATERQAGDLLAHVRMLAGEERAAIAAASGPDDDEPNAEERPF